MLAGGEALGLRRRDRAASCSTSTRSEKHLDFRDLLWVMGVWLSMAATLLAAIRGMVAILA